MTEEAPVMVGTIAFGLGINKPNVRAVVRLGLPDSIEQLYQETGRAGRDGLPADCYLLWQKRDYGLRAHFIQQISDPKERERAWGRYHRMQNFVKSAQCRPRQICEYFGENVKWEKCRVCDTCIGLPQWMSMESAAPRKTRGERSTYASGAVESMTFEPAPKMAVNEQLLEFLREWRRTTAREKMIAAFIVLHDTVLEELCVRKPKNMQELRRISGMGEKKCEMYGKQILALFPRFEKGERPGKEWRAKATNASAETLDLLRQGHSFEQIAQIRGRKVASVIALVADLLEKGEVAFQESWMAPERRQQIREACRRAGLEWMKPVKEALPEEVSFDEIRLVLAEMRREAKGGLAGQ